MALPINLNATAMLDLQVSVMSRADSNIYPEDECNGLQDEYSTTLHLIAALVVLVASVVGTIIPILGKHFPALRLPDYVYAVGKSSATGVMLAVGFIHLLFDSAEKFNVSCFPQGFKEMYEPWPFMFAMAAAILMQGIDYLIMEISRGWMEQRQLLEGGAANNASCPEGTEGNPPAIEGSTHSGDESSTDNAKLAVNPISEVVEVDVDASSPIAGCHTHQHGVAAPQHGSQLQRTVAALCMEFGVTLHSVFVGLDLGVLGDDKTKVLLVALIFHQLFEGLAMGARLADAPFGLTLELVLMMVFSLSAPLGTVGATIAMSVSRDALAGATYVVVSVVLNSMCAGILIYLGFGLLYMDFPADLKRVCPPGMKYRHRKILGMFLGLWLGAGLMGFIGKWC